MSPHQSFLIRQIIRSFGGSGLIPFRSKQPLQRTALLHRVRFSNSFLRFTEEEDYSLLCLLNNKQELLATITSTAITAPKPINILFISY